MTRRWRVAIGTCPPGMVNPPSHLWLRNLSCSVTHVAASIEIGFTVIIFGTPCVLSILWAFIPFGLDGRRQSVWRRPVIGAARFKGPTLKPSSCTAYHDLFETPLLNCLAVTTTAGVFHLILMIFAKHDLVSNHAHLPDPFINPNVIWSLLVFVYGACEAPSPVRSSYFPVFLPACDNCLSDSLSLRPEQFMKYTFLLLL